MALGVVQPSEVESLVATFEETGYIVLPLLTPGEVTALRRAFAEDRAASGYLWTLRGTDARGGPTGESGRWQSGDVLRTSTSAFASVVAHPRILQLVAALIGPAARYSSCSAMWREPVLASPPDSVPEAYQSKNIHWQLWHREAGGTTSPDHPRCIPTLQVIVYLDDCDESSHCFSVVPESVEDKLRLPTEVIDGRMRVVPSSLTGADDMWTNRPLQGRPGWENRATGTDIHAPAGTVVIQVRSHANGNSHTPRRAVCHSVPLSALRAQNNLNLHAGTVRRSSRPRRTVHMVFANTGGQWATRSAGEAVTTETLAEKLPSGVAAATELFGRVPEEYRWMFDLSALQQAFGSSEGSKRPAKEQRFSQARGRL